MAILHDATTKQKETFEDLLCFINDIGVPDERVQTIRERVRLEEPLKLKEDEAYEIARSSISALELLQSYSKCYPYMDSTALIHKCARAWEALSFRNHASRQYIKRRLMIMKNDPKAVKANPDLLQRMESLILDFDKSCTIVNMGLYRIRVLKSLFSTKKQQNEMNQSVEDD